VRSRADDSGNLRKALCMSGVFAVSTVLPEKIQHLAALESLRQQMGLRSYEVLINGLLRELLIDSTSMKSKQDGQAQAGNRQKTHRI